MTLKSVTDPADTEYVTETTVQDPPLAGYRVIGVRENRIGINAGTPAARLVPGGSCWHCGTGIAIEVVIQSTETGEVHTIGTTCAERVGLNGPELKAFLADRYAEERAERSAANVRARREAFEAEEAALEALHGPHGSLSRFLAGCSGHSSGLCDACWDAAPHGTWQRFRHRGCRCLACVEDEIETSPGRYWVNEHYTVVVDVETGEVVDDARMVDTKYGTRWRSDDHGVWLPFKPARRRTLADKGYVEAEVPMLLRRWKSRDGHGNTPVLRLGDPIVDRWGEPIPHPEVAA